MTWRSMGLWFVAGAAILFTAGAVAGIGRGEPVCERSSEAPRPLDLLRADDRTHLQHDLEEVAACFDRLWRSRVPPSDAE